MTGRPSTGIGRIPTRASTSRTSFAPAKVCSSRCSVARCAAGVDCSGGGRGRQQSSICGLADFELGTAHQGADQAWPGVEAHQHGGRRRDGQVHAERRAQGRHVDTGRETTARDAIEPADVSTPTTAWYRTCNRRTSSLRAVPARRGAERHRRALRSRRRRRSRHRPAGTPLAGRSAQIRFKTRDLVGLHEPLAGSGTRPGPTASARPGQRPGPAHPEPGHVALEPGPIIQRRSSQRRAAVGLGGRASDPRERVARHTGGRHRSVEQHDRSPTTSGVIGHGGTHDAGAHDDQSVRAEARIRPTWSQANSASALSARGVPGRRRSCRGDQRGRGARPAGPDVVEQLVGAGGRPALRVQEVVAEPGHIGPGGASGRVAVELRRRTGACRPRAGCATVRRAAAWRARSSRRVTVTRA